MTSGLPSIDYFVSAQAFEPADAKAHYREELVVLPGIGCYYEPLSPAQLATSESTLGPRAGARFACVGTPYKYLPKHDHVLVDIAVRLGSCEFLFFTDFAPLLSRKIEDRLALAFAARGLDAKRFVRFLRRQSRPAFFAMLRDCDVYLDTFVFSGFNTAMQAVECDLPIVTCEGSFMRGRFASGILRHMGMHELVARDDREYVDIAVRLASDPSYCAAMRAKMAVNSARLFRDDSPVRELEKFIWRVARA